MTSLTGASGEDFASILRSLGYRLERRPKPPEPVAEPPERSRPRRRSRNPGRRWQRRDRFAVSKRPRIRRPSAGSGRQRQPKLARQPPQCRRAEERSRPRRLRLSASNRRALRSPAAPAAAAEDQRRCDRLRCRLEPAGPTLGCRCAAAEPEMIDVWRPGRAEGRVAAAPQASRARQAVRAPQRRRKHSAGTRRRAAAPLWRRRRAPRAKRLPSPQAHGSPAAGTPFASSPPSWGRATARR